MTNARTIPKKCRKKPIALIQRLETGNVKIKSNMISTIAGMSGASITHRNE